MPRVVWKGAIVFGLVHIPVSLYPASAAKGLDLFARIERKVKQGQTHEVIEAEEGAPAPTGGEVVDLMAMLKRSLEVKRPAKGRAADAKGGGGAKSKSTRAVHGKSESGESRRRRA